MAAKTSTSIKWFVVEEKRDWIHSTRRDLVFSESLENATKFGFWKYGTYEEYVPYGDDLCKPLWLVEFSDGHPKCRYQNPYFLCHALSAEEAIAETLRLTSTKFQLEKFFAVKATPLDLGTKLMDATSKVAILKEIAELKVQITALETTVVEFDQEIKQTKKSIERHLAMVDHLLEQNQKRQADCPLVGPRIASLHKQIQELNARL